MKTIFLASLVATLHYFSGFAHALAETLDLQTVAEKSNWTKTGRAAEMERLCRQFGRAYPKRAKCVSYGKTPEGRNLKALIIRDPKPARNERTIWVQAGIHAGEIDGKDAVFLLIREILEKKITPDPLQGMRLVFIPIVNLDGHERFGKFNRPNQIGPEEMGWRTTAQNLNLNRDFVKADTLEMQALLKLWNQVHPILSVDLHVTDGAKFQPELGVILLPNDTGKSLLRTYGKQLESDLMASLSKQKHLALPFYPELEVEDDPASGFSRSQAAPRLSEGYWSTRNRLGVLIETHSWKNYANRVRSTHDVVFDILQEAQKHGSEWEKAESALDQEDLSGKPVELEFTHSHQSHVIEFPGYHYQKEARSKISGGPAIHYFEDQPEIWKIPFYDELISKLTIPAPTLGYFIPPAVAVWLRPKLALHQIQYSVYDDTTPQDLEAFRAKNALFSAKSYESHQTVQLSGSWAKETITLPKGTLFVPIHQANARLAMVMLEPTDADSFAAWGFFNAYFEQKEYMEEYVEEELGATLLASDPKIREAFSAKLKTDPDFEKNPKKRLDFFYERHPSWDTHYNLYPIFRK